MIIFRIALSALLAINITSCTTQIKRADTDRTDQLDAPPPAPPPPPPPAPPSPPALAQAPAPAPAPAQTLPQDLNNPSSDNAIANHTKAPSESSSENTPPDSSMSSKKRQNEEPRKPISITPLSTIEDGWTADGAKGGDFSNAYTRVLIFSRIHDEKIENGKDENNNGKNDNSSPEQLKYARRL